MSDERPTVTCARAARWLYPALDGALAPRDQLALDEHLAGCPACRALHDREAAFRTRFAEAAARRPPAPAALQARLRAALLPPADSTTSAPPHRPPHGPVWGWAVVAAAAAVALAALLAEPLLRERSSTPALVRSVAAQQAALAEGRLPLELRSGVSGEVAAWLRARVNFPVELPSSVGADVQVVGARLTELAAAEAAAVLYRVDGRDVALFTFPAHAIPAARAGARGPLDPGADGHPFRQYRLGTLTVTLWSRGQVGYALAAPADVAASRGCAVCHVGEEGRRLERALGEGTPR